MNMKLFAVVVVVDWFGCNVNCVMPMITEVISIMSLRMAFTNWIIPLHVHGVLHFQQTNIESGKLKYQHTH